MNSGYINRTADHRGHKIHCRDPFGMWNIEDYLDERGEQVSFTTVSKAKHAIDVMITNQETAKAKAKLEGAPGKKQKTAVEVSA